MDEHKHEHHHEDRQADAKLHPLRVLGAAVPTPDSDEHPAGPTLDLAAVQAKLRAKTGKQYWRSLEELAEDPQFEELLHREFPRQAPSEWDEGVDRRDFLKLMAASLAFAGPSGLGAAP